MSLVCLLNMLSSLNKDIIMGYSSKLHQRVIVRKYFIKDAMCLHQSILITWCKSNRKVMNRNWSNPKANSALKTKAGNK